MMTGFKFLGEDFWVVHSAAIYENKKKTPWATILTISFLGVSFSLLIMVLAKSKGISIVIPQTNHVSILLKTC